MGSSPSRGTKTRSVGRQRDRPLSTPSDNQGQTVGRHVRWVDSVGTVSGSSDTVVWPLPPALRHEPFLMHETVSYRDLEFPLLTPRVSDHNRLFTIKLRNLQTRNKRMWGEAYSEHHRRVRVKH